MRITGPHRGGWFAPNESVDEAARRHLTECTGLKSPYLEQLYTFGNVERDPFGRVVSVAYFALLSDAKDPASFRSCHKLRWVSVGDLPSLAYDHPEMIETAVQRLRAKLTYTNIVCHLLPDDSRCANCRTRMRRSSSENWIRGISRKDQDAGADTKSRRPEEGRSAPAGPVLSLRG